MLEVMDERADSVASIVVVGVGGSGNNAINRMIEMGVSGVSYIAMNTDKQTLNASKADITQQLGEKVTKGLGAGADPEKGRAAAEENVSEIEEMFKGKDMVFVTAGMGGGTGTGASPVIARVAKEQGCLTVGVVNTPFSFENTPMIRRAQAGVEELKENVDALIVIPNDNIFAAGDGKGGSVPMAEAMRLANDVLRQAVEGITNLIVRHGEINRDFADVSKVMRGQGLAHIGIGVGTGKDKALDAISRAVDSPLLDTSIETAKNVLLNIVGMVTPEDMRTIMGYVRNIAGDEVEILYGTRPDEGMEDECQVTLIATGMDEPVTHTSGRVSTPDAYRSSATYGRAPQPRPSQARPQRYVSTPDYRSAQPNRVGYNQGSDAASQPDSQGYLDDEPQAAQPTSMFGQQGEGTSRLGTGTSNLGRVGQPPVTGNTTRLRHIDAAKDGEYKLPSFISKSKDKK